MINSITNRPTYSPTSHAAPSNSTTLDSTIHQVAQSKIRHHHKPTPTSKITHLVLTGDRFPNFDNFSQFPIPLQKLCIEGIQHYNNLISISNLPQSLKNLNISGCLNLRSIPKLPQSLKNLNISRCLNLASIHDLPQDLIDLDLSGCPTLRSIPKLPQYLKHLNISRCYRLASIPDLPQYLKHLILERCSNLTSIPNLPDSLQEIWISNDLLKLLEGRTVRSGLIKNVSERILKESGITIVPF